MFNLLDFIPYYPQIEEKNFYQEIYDKKEFRDLQLEKKEEIPLYPGDLTKNQMFVSRFLSSHTPYNSLLLFHMMGTGKTCAAIGAIEQLRSETSFYKKAMIFASNDSLLDTFREQILYRCTDGKYIGETPKETKKNISSFYEFETFKKFGKNISEIKNFSLFNNRIIIIDEVHNIRIHDKENKEDTYSLFNTFLHNVENCKIILLSGTPMPDSPREFADVMNLILPVEKALPTGDAFMKKYFTEDGSIKESEMPNFKRNIAGYVSYLKKADDEDIKIVYHGKENGDFYNIQHINMSDYQSDAYNTAYAIDKPETTDGKKQGIYSNSRQASLFVFPDGTWGQQGFEKYIKKSKPTKEFSSLFVGTTEEKLKILNKYSAKYAFVISNILKSDGICFVYGDLVAGSGIILFSLLLHLFGFQSTTGKNELKSEALRYGLLINDNINNIIRECNKPQNENGNYIKVLIGSKRISEGYNFLNVKNIYVLTPHFNYTRIEQAIFRGIRFGSNKKGSIINIYLCVSISSSEDTVLNIDPYTYEILYKKDRQIKHLTRVIMESSVDCALNYKRNSYIGKDGTRDCEYQNCAYTCDNVDSSSKEISRTTYDIYYFNNIKPIVQTMGNLLRRHLRLSKENLVRILKDDLGFNESNEYLLTLLSRLKNEILTYQDFSELFSTDLVFVIEEIFRLNFFMRYEDIKQICLEKTRTTINDFEMVSILRHFITSNAQLLNQYGFYSYLREKNNLYFLVTNIDEDSFYSNYYAKFIDIDASIPNNFDNFIPMNLVFSNIVAGKNISENISALSPDYKQKLIEGVIDRSLAVTDRTSILDYFENDIIYDRDNIIVVPFLRVYSNEKWKNADENVKKVIASKKEAELKNAKDNEYGLYGTYNDSKFCIVKQDQVALELIDSRKVRSGKVCSTWKLEDLYEFVVLLSVPPLDEEFTVSKDDVVPSKFRNKDLTPEEKRNLIFWSKNKGINTLCSAIQKRLDDLGLLVYDKTCGVVAKQKATEEKDTSTKFNFTLYKFPEDKKKLLKILDLQNLQNGIQVLAIRKNKTINGIILFEGNNLKSVQSKNTLPITEGFKYLNRLLVATVPDSEINNYKEYGFEMVKVLTDKNIMKYTIKKSL